MYSTFRVEFAFNRARYKAQPRPIVAVKIELQAPVIELRLKGWRFPAIARCLNSVVRYSEASYFVSLGAKAA